MITSAITGCAHNAHAQYSEPYPYTARQTYGLQNNVKTFTLSLGYQLHFDRNGEQVDENGQPLTDRNTDLVQRLYITFPDTHTRNENNRDDSDSGHVENNYYFDYKKRILRRFKTAYITEIETIYLYNEPESQFPDKIHHTESSDGMIDLYVIDYRYKEFDDAGNWTKREAYSVVLTIDPWNDKPDPDTEVKFEEYEETAQYEYY